ncbi:MAG: YihY/virulence factor BrkB family protein [Chloroflexi bacterium]|nr:YihY/virulence factor BrkB family protein [Chloroflexota bacterium]
MKTQEHFSIWYKAFKDAFSLDTILAAAGTAYFALFSFFPFFMLIIAIASRWFDPLWVESKIITQMEFVLPGIGDLLGENLEKIIQGRFTATASALVLLAWASSALFSIITRILDRIWNGQDVRSRIRYRGLALLFVGSLSLIVLPILVVGTSVMPLLRSVRPELPIFLYQVLEITVSILFNILLFGILYRFLPHAGPAWREVWIGAVSAGTLWAVAKKIFLGNAADFLSKSNLVYGSVSVIVAFLVWVYFSGLIFFFGAHLSVGYSKAKADRG